MSNKLSSTKKSELYSIANKRTSKIKEKFGAFGFADEVLEAKWGGSFLDRRQKVQSVPEATTASKTDADSQSETISVAEAANILGVAESTLYQCIKTQQFPACKIGNTIRLSRKLLEHYLRTGNLQLDPVEQDINLDERTAEHIADIIADKLLQKEYQRLSKQIEDIPVKRRP